MTYQRNKHESSVLSPSVVGICSTLNDQEDYFRLGFTFLKYINTQSQLQHRSADFLSKNATVAGRRVLSSFYF
jgi:hypothetical protein